MADKNKRYSKNEKNADAHAKKLAPQQADHRRSNKKKQVNKPMTAAAAAG